MKPAARTDLATCNVRDEVVVYDFRNHQARCLNRTAAAVFALCDGKRTPRQIAAELSQTLGAGCDEEVVAMALAQLDDGQLLDPPLGKARTDVGRRRLLKKMALTAGLSIALPAVWSIVAPTPAYAASTTKCAPASSCMGNPMGRCCSNNGMAGTCVNGTCSGTDTTCHGQQCT
ncbi:MAG TPA: PqqD family protein [Polyangia bacterium]|nr:PqqD family protein [Polyangia bacterium]